MKWNEAAEKILQSMLENLGFEVEIKPEMKNDELTLQIECELSSHIIGKNGDRLEDIQYLVNRIVHKNFPDTPRVKVDCDNYRLEQQNKLEQSAKELAEKVLKTGKSVQTRPLNGYYRRIVHNALVDVNGVVTKSPSGDDRFKRISINPT